MKTNQIYRIYRHGDVIVYKLDPSASGSAEEKTFLQKLFSSKKEESVAVPPAARQEKLVLGYGETTGHSHLMQGDFDVLEKKEKEEEVLFRVNTMAVLSHEEHDRIVLEPGLYLKVSQVEYDPFNDLMRYVRD